MKKTAIYLFGILTLIITTTFWWQGSYYLFQGADVSSVSIAIGRLLGLFGQLAILTQLILIGRITFIEQLFGHDKMNKVHRWLGYSIAFFFVLHPLLLIYGYALQSHVGVINQFISFLANWEDVLLAVIGFIIFAVVISLSLPPVRKKLQYEHWYFVHLTIYLAIGFTFLHQIQTADVSHGAGYIYWMLINFGIGGIYVGYRFIRPWYNFYKYKFYVDRVVSETSDVYSVYIKGININRFHFKAGQFSNYTFLQRGMWFTHPFSFSAAPNGEYIRISVKKSGDFTNNIHTLQSGTKVIIDGPLGVFTEKSAHKDKYLFIAGGIGITPIRSMIEALSKKNADMVLLYGNRTIKDTALQYELEQLISKYHVVLSASSESGYETGYIDREKIERLVPDYKDREIYICGPAIMMDKVISTLDAMGMPRKHVHFERFAY